MQIQFLYAGNSRLVLTRLFSGGSFGCPQECSIVVSFKSIVKDGTPLSKIRYLFNIGCPFIGQWTEVPFKIYDIYFLYYIRSSLLLDEQLSVLEHQKYWTDFLVFNTGEFYEEPPPLPYLFIVVKSKIVPKIVVFLYFWELCLVIAFQTLSKLFIKIRYFTS